MVRALAAAAGYLLDWSELNAEANIGACQQHLITADLGPLITVLRPVVRRLT
ncbi:hypothetical protein ACGFIK_07645 [Micromonospora sp. NPDC048871]|uniref:hypothetical protein n=1 Tax=unclassified Micromonospora TaxID=2617518 RepID=UPI002E0D6248|nr:hypothetical protein OIE53_02390 [Micromonospora sp. NBC_01739]